MQYNKSRKNSILFWVINILLIFNVFKIYELGLANDKIRLLCYAFLALNFPICILQKLIKKNFKINVNTFNVYIGIYMLVVAIKLVLGGELQWDVWLNCFLVPGVIIECCIGLKNININKILKYEEGIAYILIILFIYNKLFLHQAGAGKLNSVFYVILLTPVVLCIEDKFHRNTLLILISICSIISMKRTALIIFAICYMIFLFSENKASAIKLLKIIIYLIAFILLIFWVQDKFNIDMISKIKNMAEDGGSGRSDIYITLIREFFNRPFTNIMFGGGTYAVINIIGGTAHNDFLEIIYDFGLLGFIAYLGVHIFLINEYKKMKRMDYKFKTQFLISIVCFFIMSMLSHVIMIPTYILHFGVFWGLTMNDFEKYGSNISNKVKKYNKIMCKGE